MEENNYGAIEEINSLSNKTLLFGILSWFIPIVNIVLAILGIVYGKKAFKLMKEYHLYEKQSQTNIGYVLSWVSVILMGVGIVLWTFILIVGMMFS